MSGSDKKTYHYSAADIEKYLNGELSAAEMHALEKAALEDPFLADALEGIGLHGSMSGGARFKQDLAELGERLDQRVAADNAVPVRRRVRPMLLRYAAVLILLAGLGLTFYYGLFTRHMATDPLARAEQKAKTIAPAGDTENHPAALPAETSPPAETATPVVTPDKELAKADEKAGEPVLSVGQTGKRQRQQREEAAAGNKMQGETHKEPGARTAAEAQARTSAEAQTVTQVAPQGLVKQEKSQDSAFAQSKAGQELLAQNANKDVAEVSPDLVKKMRDTVISQEGEGIAVDKGYYIRNANSFSDSMKLAAFAKRTRDMKALSKKGDELVFTGRVIDINNNALAGASLLLQGSSRINVSTDRNGYFSLRVPRNDSASRIVVQYTGYTPGDVTLSRENLRGNVIQLQPQTIALNEVVISGFGSQRKEILHRNIDMPTDPLSLVAVPAKGWPAYNEYLELGKKLATVDSTIKGNESISFLVDRKGQLSSFRVEQSLSPAHDSASIHMIRTGPSWQLLQNKRKVRARVIITW